MNQAVTTRGDLERMGMDALNKDRVGAVVISGRAGGVSFTSVLEVMEVAKLMAVADKGVPPHLRNNPGMCLRIVFDAVEWEFKPFSVADQSYEVNGRLAYQSQLIHAVIEKRAPLAKRLECAYEGDGADRVCIITGTFAGDETREYRSPKFGAIPTKNSPLWKSDPDQQQFYYASRSWCRKWCPDILLGVYSQDEIAAIAPENATEPAATGLLERLQGADRSEGHQPGGAAKELDNIAGRGNTEIKPAKEEKAAEPPIAETKPKAGPQQAGGRAPRLRRNRKAAEPKTEPAATAEPAKTEEPPKPKGPPTNAAEYQTYAIDWIDSIEDRDELEARWEGEDDMRNELKVPVTVRIALRGRLNIKTGHGS